VCLSQLFAVSASMTNANSLEAPHEFQLSQTIALHVLPAGRQYAELMMRVHTVYLHSHYAGAYLLDSENDTTAKRIVEQDRIAGRRGYMRTGVEHSVEGVPPRDAVVRLLEAAHVAESTLREDEAKALQMEIAAETEYAKQLPIANPHRPGASAKPATSAAASSAASSSAAFTSPEPSSHEKAYNELVEMMSAQAKAKPSKLLAKGRMLLHVPIDSNCGILAWLMTYFAAHCSSSDAMEFAKRRLDIFLRSLPAPPTEAMLPEHLVNESVERINEMPTHRCGTTDMFISHDLRLPRESMPLRGDQMSFEAFLLGVYLPRQLQRIDKPAGDDFLIGRGELTKQDDIYLRQSVDARDWLQRTCAYLRLVLTYYRVGLTQPPAWTAATERINLHYRRHRSRIPQSHILDASHGAR
jgi:hypothetical protein